MLDRQGIHQSVEFIRLKRRAEVWDERTNVEVVQKVVYAKFDTVRKPENQEEILGKVDQMELRLEVVENKVDEDQHQNCKTENHRGPLHQLSQLHWHLPGRVE
mgnify:CR=1 FL=1